MDNFFKKDLCAKDYRLKASEKCNKLSNSLAVTFLVYLLISVAVVVLDNLTGTKEVVDYGGFEIEVKNTWFNSIFSLISAGAFYISFVMISKKVYVGENVEVKNLFDGFKDFTRAFLINLLQSIYTFLWALLFVIPGIVKAFAYSMSYFIAVDNPGLSANECITKSKEMMNGHKWDYFCLMLSYIGWILLSVLTCGILFLWVAPKISQASYLFYLKVSGKGVQLEEAEQEEFLEA